MSIKEYIESGIIETVIMGLASREDELELRLKRKEHPEVESYAADCEAWLESMAQQQAVAAPPANREAFLQNIAGDVAGSERPGTPAKVVPMPSRKRVLQWTAAASILLLAGSAILNIYLYREFEKTKQAYREEKLNKELLASRNQQYEKGINELRQRNSLLVSPRINKIPLTGVTGKEQYQATVFWNKETSEMYLVANNLPAPPPGKQYQLWALVNGQPLNAGVLADCNEFCKLIPVSDAQAFAITLEKTGGSESPDLTQLYVTGKA